VVTQKINAHIACGRDSSAQASPASMNITPEIMGFRTNRYGPVITRRLGGSHGANVPFPSFAKRESDAANSRNPMPSAAIPIA